MSAGNHLAGNVAPSRMKALRHYAAVTRGPRAAITDAAAPDGNASEVFAGSDGCERTARSAVARLAAFRRVYSAQANALTVRPGA
jgi:hypothetical protein